MFFCLWQAPEQLNVFSYITAGESFEAQIKIKSTEIQWNVPEKPMADWFNGFAYFSFLCACFDMEVFSISSKFI